MIARLLVLLTLSACAPAQAVVLEPTPPFPGAVTPRGPKGDMGCAIIQTNGMPAAALGRDCDFAFDAAAGKVYGPKTAGQWGSGVVMSPVQAAQAFADRARFDREQSRGSAINSAASAAAAASSATAASSSATSAAASKTAIDAYFTGGVLTPSHLPFPGASTLGGVLANVGASHQWVSGVNTSTGALLYSQPSFSDLLGSLTAAQLPEFSGGDCTSSAGATGLICTKTNGVTFAASATTDATVSSNINYTNGLGGGSTISAFKKFAETVSVLEFGADPTGVADSAAAFTNAIKSNRLIVVPPGTYLMKSKSAPWTCTSPAQICALDDTSVYVANQSNFKISGYGATINVDSSIALSSVMTFFKADNFVVEGLKLNGNRTGLLTTDESAGFAIMSSTRFVFRDINFASGFGDNGAAYAGDWLVHGRIEGNTMTNVGQCADFAFVKDLEIVGNYSVGFSTGSIAGPKCWSFINDVPNASTNNTGATITQNDGVRLVDNYVKNFGEAVLIAAGKNFSLTGNVFESNPGISSTSSGGYGVLIYYINGGSSTSVGFPPQNIVVAGNVITGNGATVAGGGVVVGQANSTSETLQNIVIANNILNNNNSRAIYTDGTTHAANVTHYGNQFIAGANQSTAVDANTLALSTATLNSTSGSTSLAISTTIYNATSLTLGPGDWFVTAECAFNGATTTTVNYNKCGIDTSNNTIPSGIGQFASWPGMGGTPYNYASLTLPVGPVRYQVTSSQQVFCNGQSSYGSTSPSMYCDLKARRAP